MKRVTHISAAAAALALGGTALATGLTHNPDIEHVGRGVRVVATGVSLADAESPFVFVPNLNTGRDTGPLQLRATVQGPLLQAVLYWGGRGTPPGDDSILIGPFSNPVLIQGELIGSERTDENNMNAVTEVFGGDLNPVGPLNGDHSIFPGDTAYAYRADVTGLVNTFFDTPGEVRLGIADPTPDDPDSAIHGATLIVIYQSLSDTTARRVSVFEGNDFANGAAMPSEAGKTQAIAFHHGAATEDRPGQLIVVASGGSPEDKDEIVISNNVDQTDRLDGSDGGGWDTDRMMITLPGGEAWTTVELISPDDVVNPDSFSWIVAALGSTCTGSIGDFVWEDTDGDGVQDAAEPGIENVRISLFQVTPQGDVFIEDTLTNAVGFYEFTDLCAGTYRLTWDDSTYPENFGEAKANQGQDDSIDSDCDGQTALVTLPDDAASNSTVDCGLRLPPAFGACCFALDGSCQFLLEDECLALGGIYQGSLSQCEDVVCPILAGACCIDQNTCTEAVETDCIAFGGTFQGVLTVCATTTCPGPPGACCLANNQCIEVEETECANQGGVFQGEGTDCASTNCGPAFGACCVIDGSCTVMIESNCDAQGGSYVGDFTVCSSGLCPPAGACCFDDGSCSDIVETACLAQGGTFNNAGDTCVTFACPQPPGACCLITGECVEVTEEVCTAQGGAFDGDQTLCADANCPQPPGACCMPDGSCTDGTEADCLASGGSYQGDFTICATTNCEQPPGACCLIDGTCTDVIEESCDTLGGTFQGDLNFCAAVDCPQPPGACCLSDGSCIDVTEEQCVLQSGVFNGDQTLCNNVTCPQPGACCFVDGSCAVAASIGGADCTAAGGDYQGDDIDCVTANCPQPPGACCLTDGSCIDVTEEDCNVQGGAFNGDQTLCAAIGCDQPGACCLIDGTCIQAAVVGGADCIATGGFYPGDNSLCADVDCPQPPGACCLPDGTCGSFPEEACDVLGGQFNGDFSTCPTVACDQPGACCLADGSCFTSVVTGGADCALAGGIYQGDNTDCATAACPQPLGACCLTDGGCSELTEEDCDLAGGLFDGDFTTCAATDCPQPGACCFDDGSCAIADEIDGPECIASGGAYQGDDTDCATADCPQPGGACCLGAVCNDVDNVVDCDALGGTYLGDFTFCEPDSCAAPAAGSACCSDKGSLLYFSKVDLRWDFTGTIVKQDTFISITNDAGTDVEVLGYFINGDPPLEADGNERAHPGWNFFDNGFTLTGNQPQHFSAIFGQPLGLTSFTALDPGPPPGRLVDPANAMSDRILRGYIVLWAVNDTGVEINWNHLSGHATIVDYENDAAWSYAACAHQVVANVGIGQATGTPGVLNLDGVEYAPGADLLLLNFIAADSNILSRDPDMIDVEMDITIHPLSADLRQDDEGPVTTKAHFDVWNQNEVKFSGLTRCITCWDQTLARQYADFNNYLTIGLLGTDCGKARIDGQASTQCDEDFDPNNNVDFPFPPGPGDPVDLRDIVSIDAAITGVAAKVLRFPGATEARAGHVMVRMGTESAVIRFDPVGTEPPTDPGPQVPKRTEKNQDQEGTTNP